MFSRFAVRIGYVALLTTAALGCGTVDSPKGAGATTGSAIVCKPGETQACTGPGGCKGGQACTQDGAGYEDCDCGAGGAAVSTSAAGGFTGGTGGDGGSGGDGCVDIDGTLYCPQADDPTPAPSNLAGALPDPPGGLPVAASLSLNGFTIADQGSCGSCAAFATRNAMGLRGIAEQHPFVSYSPAHIWQIAGYGSYSCKPGSNIGTIFDENVKQKEYVVPSTIWPYNPASPEASLDAAPSAAVLGANGVAYIAGAVVVDAHSTEDVKRAVTLGWPAVIGVKYAKDSGWASADGTIDVPPSNAKWSGYHAVTITAFNDVTSRFTFANSWGSKWGNSGFGTVSYAFVDKYSTGGRALAGLTYADACPPGGCVPPCGDGMCSAAETQASCCKDCGCSNGLVCQNDTCGCPAGLSQCGGACVDLASSSGNCGSCGHVCQANEVCASGQCKLNCGALSNCNGSCVDLSSNVQNCGSCGNACGPQKTCTGGQCVCKPTSPPTEVCDNIDNDCDGFVDEDPACVVCVDLQDVSLFLLAKTKGDAEFNGHGPDVDVTVNITRTPTSVTAQSCVTMVETVSDWTTGVLCSSQTVPIANVGLVGDSFFEVKYVDTDHAWDDAKAESYSIHDNPTVTGVQCVGDTTGNDICSNAAPPECSTCMLTLGCIQVKVPPQ